MSGRPKRPNGSGTRVLRRKDGLYLAAITIAGTRRYVYSTTERGVREKLAALKEQGRVVKQAPARTAVGEFLSAWLETVKPQVRASTYLRYEQVVRVQLAPALGRTLLADLTTLQIQTLYATLSETRAPRTVQFTHVVLKYALRQAVEWELLAVNPATRAKPPRVPRGTMATLSAEQARTLLEAAQGDPLEAWVTLLLHTGMRIGETLALRWEDLDLDGGTLAVQRGLQRDLRGRWVVGEPKRPDSNRPVPLLPAVVASLRRQRARQTEQRLAAGAAWREQGLVFPGPRGGPASPADVRNRFYTLLKHAGLPHVHPHQLRHSVATFLMRAGVSPRVVADLLGHADVRLTLDLYSHVSRGDQRGAVESLDRLFQG